MSMWLTARNSLSLISTSPGPWTVKSAPARALTAFARQCTLLVWPTQVQRHATFTAVSQSAFTHDDRYDDRFANTVRRPVCKPIVMCEQSNSLFSNRSSYRSQESNMFDSCDPTDDRRDVWTLLRSVWRPVCKLMQSIWPLIGWLYINGLDGTCWLY